jgi:ribosomal protein L31
MRKGIHLRTNRITVITTENSSYKLNSVHSVNKLLNQVDSYSSTAFNKRKKAEVSDINYYIARFIKRHM